MPISAWLNARSSTELTVIAALLALTVLLKRASLGIGVYALIAWPGTLCHELAHAIVGFLLHAKPCNMRLFPKNLGMGYWQLGSVSFRNVRWWNAPWTAMAPLLLAPLAVLIALWGVVPAWEQGRTISGISLLLFSSIILQASWPSSTDFKVALPGILILGFLAWFLL